MNYLGMLKGEQWIQISEDFDYVRATQDFVGLKLFPLFRTENMKLAMAELVEGGDIPVMALVHAFDTEAKIGDRPDYEEIKLELLLIKEKINQGEALRKKIKDMGMSAEEKSVIEAVYNDASNMISRVITRFEAMADEALCSGKLVIKENNVDTVVDYHLPDKNKLSVSAWGTAGTDILGDLVKIKKASKNKIVRAFTSNKIMGYILNNTAIAQIASDLKEYATEDWAKSYIQSKFGIEFVIVDGTYKLSAQDTEEKNFFDEDVISFVTTNGTLGYTYVTSTPEEDCNIADRTTGFVSVTQYVSEDPATVWTKASAVGLPAFRNIKELYVCNVLS